MFCPKCGTKLPEEANFCFKCGCEVSQYKIPLKSKGDSFDKIFGQALVIKYFSFLLSVSFFELD